MSNVNWNIKRNFCFDLLSIPRQRQRVRTGAKFGTRDSWKTRNGVAVQANKRVEYTRGGGHPSDLALYVGSEKYLPTDVDDYTGMRHNLKAPFREENPQSSLVYLEDIRCVMPDVTHMITRCVESDLRKAAQKIVNEKPVYKVSLQRLEENCTQRVLKKRKFQFDLQVKGSELKKGIVGPVSLSGTSALVAIADKEEFEQDVPNLFEIVWGNEILFETRDNTNKQNARAVSNAFSVLKSMHPHMAKSDTFTTNDCANLLQHSLNKCTIILRASKHGLNTDTAIQVLV